MHLLDNFIIIFLILSFLPLSQVMYLEQLLACVDILLHQCESDCGSISLQLLQVLVSVQSLSTEPQLSAKVRKFKANETIPDASF